MQKVPETVIVPEAYDGSRLDKALELLAPEQGARQRKRLLLSGAVCVDGRSRPKGYIVRMGQEISLAFFSVPDPAIQAHLSPEIIARTTTFAALLKKGRTHSQTISSSRCPGVDASLSGLFPDNRAILLNRLDFLTSGLLLVGLSPAAEQIYKQRQEAGEVRKHYFALVSGRLEAELVVRNALDTARRRKVKVLNHEAEPLRQSVVRPLVSECFALSGRNCRRTLVHVCIQKGARHQIRAHLAASGHPIIGDTLYGSETDAAVLFLHHFAIKFAEFAADSRPEWPALPVGFKSMLLELQV